MAKKGNSDIDFNQFVQRYFENDKSLNSMSALERNVLYEKVSSNIANMEGNVVYFPEEIN